MRSAVLVLLLLVVLGVVADALADDGGSGDFMKMHAACRHDRDRLCGHVHRLVPVLDCIHDHEDELEPACRASVKACPAYRCSRDAMRLCPDVKKHDQVLSCMWLNRKASTLSGECTGSRYQRTNFDDARHVCHRDRLDLCGAETGLPAIMSCLFEKRDQDASKFCPHVDNEHDFMKCIYEHRAELSSSSCTLGQAGDEHGAGCHSACKADAKRFCQDSKGVAQTMSCLVHHEAKLSDKCKAVVDKCPAFHCADDVLKFCPDSTTKRAFVACLWKHRKELSPQCMDQPDDVFEHADDDRRHGVRRLGVRSANGDVGREIEDEIGKASRTTLFVGGAIMGGVVSGLAIWAVSSFLGARKRRREAQLAVSDPAHYQRI
ncbi:unnamed protein product (mitochondrion) [Plasmodiophora brassicae]|uniref:FZ domain-containing protein n=1 Tax=Plasmodiophora brassicae TaxID=37360 RepID=A0A3P3YNV3_PLABS|nr:unnamed protein product [Plasmodiophora brassicae]